MNSPNPICFLVLIHLTFSSIGQDFLLKQRYQQVDIPLSKIIIYDYLKEEHRELLFSHNNRLIEEINFLEDNSLESKIIYTWDDHKMIQAEFISSYHQEKEAFIESDSGLLYQIEFKPGFSKYKKVNPGKVVINGTPYLTDEHFNILAIEQFDSLGQRWVTEMDGFGTGIRLTGYNRNNEVLETQLLPTPHTGLNEAVTSSFKKISQYDEYGRILRLEYFIRSTTNPEFIKIIDKEWVYE